MRPFPSAPARVVATTDTGGRGCAGRVDSRARRTGRINSRDGQLNRCARRFDSRDRRLNSCARRLDSRDGQLNSCARRLDSRAGRRARDARAGSRGDGG